MHSSTAQNAFGAIPAPGPGRLVWILSLTVFFLTCRRAAPDSQTTGAQGICGRKVEIVKTGDRFQLCRNGAPYYIKGAAGNVCLNMVRDAGGNSIRTYTTAGLDTLLDQAAALDLTVLVGIYLGREREGFDYHDPQATYRQTQEVVRIVNRYKNHPAVLGWVLGNELDNETGDAAFLWQKINELALIVKQTDPDHPVTTSVFFWIPAIKQLLENAPAFDFICLNSFGSVWELRQSLRQEIPQYDRPYLLSEWGAAGPWEVPHTQWSAPIEESIPQKCRRIKTAYTRDIVADSARCLGSYIFYWGAKQETTPSWFSFFTETQEKTELVDLCFELWSGKSPLNRAPRLDSLTIGGRSAGHKLFLQTGASQIAAVRSSDPEGDQLRYRWEITPDAPRSDPQDINKELWPDSIPGLIRESKGNQIRFDLPAKTGPYRLSVWAYDDHGSAAYANIPFFVVNHRLVE